MRAFTSPLSARSNSLINGTLAPAPQQDGQSRLQQWKQANATNTSDCSNDKVSKSSYDHQGGDLRNVKLLLAINVDCYDSGTHFLTFSYLYGVFQKMV